MIDLLRWALQKHERSKDAARRRLHLILVLDRVGMSPEYMEIMKRDIIQTVSRYLVVDEESVEMDMKRLDQSLVLVSNIHVKELVRPQAAALSVRDAQAGPMTGPLSDAEASAVL